MPMPVIGSGFDAEALPRAQQNEVELRTDRISAYEVGQAVHSAWTHLGNFCFRLVVYPRGLVASRGSVAAFVEAKAAKAAKASAEEAEWSFAAVKFQVTLLNWIDYRVSIGRLDEGEFSHLHVDRGWADLLPQELATAERGWVGAHGGLLLRAACSLQCTEPAESKPEVDGEDLSTQPPEEEAASPVLSGNEAVAVPIATHTMASADRLEVACEPPVTEPIREIPDEKEAEQPVCERDGPGGAEEKQAMGSQRSSEISVAASVPGETQALVVSVPATVARRPSVPQEAAPKAPPSPAAVPMFGDRTEMV
ncbi:unnamed protein product [Effrenium voratum]|nr:unnamed protein product [Effrenium voratum]